MNTSNKILLVCVMAILLAVGSFGFYVGSNFEKMPLSAMEQKDETRVRDSSFVTNDIQLDTTLNVSFSHLVTDFPYTEVRILLDTVSKVHVQSFIENKAYDQLISISVNNDTLFLENLLLQKDYFFVNRTALNDEDFYGHRSVPQRNYLSIVIHTPIISSIKTPSNNFVKLYHTEHYPTKNQLESLHIIQYEGSEVSVDANVKTIEVENRGYDWSTLRLRGQAEKVIVERMIGRIDAFECYVDSMWVNAQQTGRDFQVKVSCNDYLYANLTGKGVGDVIYRGTPVIEKKENDFGRVINGNLPERRENN